MPRSSRISIKTVETQLFRVPLAGALTDAKHGQHSHFELVTVTVTDRAGRRGVGYTYTGGTGGRAIAALVDHELRRVLVGTDADLIARRWADMQSALHYVGRGGLVSFAISACDGGLRAVR